MYPITDPAAIASAGLTDEPAPGTGALLPSADLAASRAGAATEPAADAAGEPQAEVPARRMIPVSELAGHPGNVREDLALTREFTASIAAEGVRIPLLVTTGPGGGWRVIEGHRRLAAAIEAGLPEVPCDIDPGRAGDEAGQYVDMLLANSDSYRANYRPGEEAAALFAAHEAGATRTRLRKATGRTAAEVKTALAAGSLPAAARARAEQASDQVSLDDLAILAEFEGDQDATDALLQAIEYRDPLEHTAQRIRHHKAEAAEHARLRSELEAAGVTVTDEIPPGAQLLDSLLHDGEELTPEGHAACPGRGVTFRTWNLLEPVHYCASPAEHGHASRWAAPARPGGTTPLTIASGPGGTGGTGTPGAAGGPPEPSGPDRRLVVAGNKAWEAAAVVRHRWITDNLLARRSAPHDVHEFLTQQLLAMPQPLDSNLSGARHRSLFTKLTGGRDAARLAQDCGTATTGRLAILALAPLLTAYEQAMTEGEGRSTWRTDRYSPCPRADAAAYLTFLASLGYQLSDIEQAVASQVPWTGTTPLITVLGSFTDPGDSAEPDGSTELADGDADPADGAGPDEDPGQDSPAGDDATAGDGSAAQAA
jgi:ParB-like chromosome segregation protein Spo0J